MELFEFICNVLGFALTAYGTRYTYKAFKEDHAEFSSDPLLKTPVRIRGLAKAAWYKILRRKPTQRVSPVGAAGEMNIASSVHIARAGPEIPDGTSVEESIKLLEARIRQAEQQAQKDRDWLSGQVRANAEEDDKREQRFDTDVRRVEEKLRGVAIGTLPKQVRGLIWVAFGALLAAAADVVPPIVDFLQALSFKS